MNNKVNSARGEIRVYNYRIRGRIPKNLAEETRGEGDSAAHEAG